MGVVAFVEAVVVVEVVVVEVVVDRLVLRVAAAAANSLEQVVAVDTPVVAVDTPAAAAGIQVLVVAI